MIKRAFDSQDIRILKDRVDLAFRTVKEGLALENSQRTAVVEAVRLSVEKEYIEVLKTIPIEEINADKSGIRTGLLRDNGIGTVFDVLKTDMPALSAIYGIGTNMAARAKVIAQKIADDIRKNVKLRINLDNKTFEYTRIVQSVSGYLKTEDLTVQSGELGRKLPQDAQEELKRIQAANSSIRWFFTRGSKKQEAIDAYNRLLGKMSGINALPLYNEIKHAKNITEDEAWEDFSLHSVSFYNVLERLVPEHFSSGSDGYGLSDEIRGEVESTELDLTGLKCTLRGYQVWGVKYVLRQKRVLLGDEMGLGKTIQALAAMVAIRNAGGTHFLVICPASVIINWCREIESKSDLAVTKVHSTGKAEAFNNWLEKGGVAVTNYETLGSLKFPETGFSISMIVVDEAHYVKNAAAKRSKKVFDVCTYTDRVLFMTGTPIENNVSEMIRLLEFLQPAVADHAKSVSTTAYADYFKERISPVYYRRKRDDVLAELPELIQIQEWCDMTPEDEKQYVNDIIGGNVMEVRRVSFRNADYLNTSSKIARLREIADLAGEDGRKLIVFSFFLDTLEKVASIFAGRCIGVINGSVPPAGRQEIIDEFDKAPAGSVLAAQIQSGGTGLNIQTASVVVICEPQYKPSTEMQAISRAYRMGQTRNVIVHRLLCTNTIEERIMQILYAKQEEFNTFADESSAAKLDMEIDNNTINNIMADEIRRIREKYASGEEVLALPCIDGDSST